MKKVFLMLLSVLLLSSCGEKKEPNVKAPTRVKTQVVSPDMVDNAQTYVGIVEEREATAVSFTGMSLNATCNGIGDSVEYMHHSDGIPYGFIFLIHVAQSCPYLGVMWINTGNNVNLSIIVLSCHPVKTCLVEWTIVDETCYMVFRMSSQTFFFVHNCLF